MASGQIKQPATQPQIQPVTPQAQILSKPAQSRQKGVLGTLPSRVVGSAAPTSATGVLGFVFGTIAGPMPTPGIQSTARELLLDTSFRQTRGSDGLARAEALYRLGFIEDATGIAVDNEGQSVADLAARARMFLAMGRVAQACDVADVSDLPKGAEPGPTFAILETLSYCKLENGDTKAAKLIAGILDDQGGGDALFQALLKAAISGKRPKIRPKRTPNLRPVHVTLFAKAGVPVPESLVADADLAVLPGLARNAVDPALRLAATERLVAAGLAGFLELDSLYADIAPPNFDPAAALKKKVAGTAMGRASIYRLLDEIGDDETRMALSLAAYEGARADRAGAAASVIFGDIVSAIAPRPELARFAGSAARLLLDADQPDIAAGWIAAGEYADDAKNRLKPFSAHNLKTIAAILAPDAGFGLGAGVLGADVGAVKLSKSQRAHVSTEAKLLASLGDYVPPVLVELAGGHAPASGQVAETGPVAGLQALGPLSGVTIAKTRLDTVLKAIAALRGLGLEGEARRLAADYLTARF